MSNEFHKLVQERVGPKILEIADGAYTALSDCKYGTETRDYARGRHSAASEIINIYRTQMGVSMFEPVSVEEEENTKENMNMKTEQIILGSEVEDKVTGFKGIAVARAEYLNGCSRIAVQPMVDKDNKVPDAKYVDEPQLKVISLAKASIEGSKDTGGPHGTEAPLNREFEEDK